MTSLEPHAAAPDTTLSLPAMVDPTGQTAVFAPVQPGPPMLPETTEITCPSCGTVSYFTELGRDAGGFCRECDFPLFWARAPRALPGDADGGDSGLRRLPGTAGRVALATIDCPVCTEPNPVAAVICIRCGSELRPAPVMALPEPEPIVLPEPEPEPAPPKKPEVLWPWILLAVMAVLGAAALALAVTL